VNSNDFTVQTTSCGNFWLSIHGASYVEVEYLRGYNERGIADLFARYRSSLVIQILGSGLSIGGYLLIGF